ncbi:MAG TPA: pseudouridine synthase [Caulobacteraceae bacterium]|nr:pseudouridine synthase [Caulobacteraceae bacterium]
MRARLDRLLANLGYGSRREVHALISARAVRLDGTPLRDPAGHIEIGSGLPDRMSVNGQPLDPPAPLTLILHKPLGVVCSHREAGRSVYELLPPRWRARMPALSTVGRLDAETSGLILITDDGPLLHRLISPKSAVPKRYRAELDRPLRGDEATLFASGTVMLDGELKPLAPAVLQPLSATSALLAIGEGRYHQVRRMFAAAGNHVTALHREAIGSLELPADLAPGQWRIAGAEEIAAALTVPATTPGPAARR